MTTGHMSITLQVDADPNYNNYISDLYCTNMISSLSITRTTKKHDVPFILPINSQSNLSRSTRPQSEKNAQQL